MPHPPVAFEIQGSRNLPIAGHTWIPNSPPRATLVVVHGITEHSGRYHTLAQRFLDAGFALWTWDLRGHGRSAGRRGHIESWREFTDDLSLIRAQAESRFPSAPHFVLGHSLGSLIALANVAQFPNSLAGLIVSGVALHPVGVAKPYLVALARFLATFWPTFSIPVPIRNRLALSRNPAIDAQFAADPLVLRSVTAKFGVESLALIDWLKSHSSDLQLPLLAHHGDADPLAAVSGAQWLFENIRSQDRRLSLYPGSLHEVFNDHDQDRFYSESIAWLTQHSQP